MAPISSWSTELPEELLEIILRQPTDAVNLYNYRNVCRSWRSVVDKVLASSPPLLLVYDEKGIDCIWLFNIFTGDSSFCKIPRLPRRIHSWHGWLAMDFTTSKNHAHDLCLYNPLSRARIGLPTLMFENSPNSRNLKFISSISNHTNPSSIALAILEGQSLVEKLMFWKPGDEEWTPVDTPFDFETPFGFVTDIIGYKCGGFCAIDYSGNLTQFELSPVPRAKQIQTGKIYDGNHKALCHAYSYLVESLSGDLLLVNRCFFPHKEFKIYRLDWEKMKWDEMRSLGDAAIFLARNQSVCIRADESTAYSRNCIYFTDDVSLFDDFFNMLRLRDDFGVYHMANKTIHRFPCLFQCHTGLRYRWLSYTNFPAIGPDQMELLKSKPSEERSYSLKL
ncbi:F-box protein At2g26160-like [Corylus avellana]|uniref:F-box protein At2g26160-like n=1 Tax=Corylus avellana TaxID=13451 RepID=UPI00286B802E|nr:F-box protein At2g26160-like [Corylus avellana]